MAVGNVIIFIVLQLMVVLTLVNAHGRLMNPPARNAMWRFGYPNPVNYDDNELYCGGYSVMWEQNDGKCGVCGDAYHSEEPRPHEAGGMFARGIISKFYAAGQTIDIEVELTANHMGYFEVSLCPNNNPQVEADQECFDKYPLKVDDAEDNKYIIVDTEKKGIFTYRVELPPGVTCTQCILQWTYYTGNMWGTCPNGTQSLACGKPEIFRNCADVAITSNTGGIPPLFIGKNRNPFVLYYKDFRAPDDENIFPLIVRDQVCLASNAFRALPGMGDWCQTNCMRYPPNCPESVCHCPTSCEAIGDFANEEGADVYCQYKCIKHNADCPADRCKCY